MSQYPATVSAHTPLAAFPSPVSFPPGGTPRARITVMVKVIIILHGLIVTIIPATLLHGQGKS